MIKLLIVRHGKTSWNDKHILQGSTDIDLNEEGIKCAKELSKKLNDYKIDICISSPLLRATNTSKLLVNNRCNIMYDNLITERGFGNFEGKKIDFDLVEKMWDYKLNYKSNNIESLQKCLNRANTFLTKIKNEYDNKTILVVSHGSFIKALHYNIIGYNEDTDFLSFNPKNTEIYEYILNK